MRVSNPSPSSSARSWRTPRNPGRPPGVPHRPGSAADGNIHVPAGSTKGKETLVKRTALLVGLLLLLLCTMGFARGSQMDEAEVLERASLIPTLEEYYSKPTVETTADYDGGKDLWRVVLTEQTSGKEVARFRVADDSGGVSGIEVSPRADEFKYPRLSEQKAIKLAAASPEVREEFTRHGPHNAVARYEKGAWTVRFYVDERGAIGGRPTE